MTWSPWNHFTIHATEDIILANAKALVTTGLHKLGYNLVYELNNTLPLSLSPSPSLSLSLSHTHSLYRRRRWWSKSAIAIWLHRQ